jgi:hypothetical protein
MGPNFCLVMADIVLMGAAVDLTYTLLVEAAADFQPRLKAGSEMGGTVVQGPC